MQEYFNRYCWEHPMSWRLVVWFGSLVIAASAALADPQTPQAVESENSALTTEAGSASDMWASIRDSNDPDDFEQFLKLYPDHAFATLARTKLDSLHGQASGGQSGVSTEAAQEPSALPSGAPQSIFGTAPQASQMSEDELATAMQEALQNIGCYGGSIDGDWGAGSRSAMERFNSMSGKNLTSDEPTQDALAAVSSWKGGDCPAVATRKSTKPSQRASTSKKKKVTRQRTGPSGQGGPSFGVIINKGGGGIGIGF